MKKLLVLVVFLAALPSYAADTTLTQTGAQVQSAITAAANSAAVTGVVSGAGDGTYSAKAIGTSSGQIAAGDHTHATLHTQNTDTGTTSATFQLDSGNTGPKLKNNSGVVEAKNSADNAYVGVKALSYDTAKTSGTAGRAGVYEANSTSTYQVGWEGPANHGADLWFKYSDSSPASGQVMVFGTPSGTPAVSAVTWQTLGLPTEVDGHATGNLTAAQVTNTVVYNTGQGGADVTLTLPTAAAGYNALFTVGTAQSYKWRVRAGANDKIYLIAADGTIGVGTDNHYATLANAQVGQSFACWTFKTDAYDWMCKAISIGTSTFAAE